MKPTRESLIPLIEPVVAKTGAYVVDLSIKGDHRSRVVELLVDTDTGISIDACATLSRELGPILEASELFDGAYRLEVSSPGLENPLRLLRQYPKNIGRRFRVQYRREETTEDVRGTLRAVVGSTLTFEPDDAAAIEIPFEQILKCTVELPW